LKAWLAVLLVVTFSWPPRPALEQLNKAIQDRGAAKVVEELNSQKSSTVWESIEDRVATGKERWLDVAKALRVYSDAGVSEGLDNAVAEALPKNAAGVLGVLGNDRAKEFTVERICSTQTFIEVPRAARLRHLEASLVAVQRVEATPLKGVKQACIAALDGDRGRIKAH
jgi:hypothetical protein